MAPKLPKELKFEEVTATLKQHFQLRPLVIAECYYFRRRHQAAGETVGEFVAELRRLSTHCQFGSYLEEVLRDRFVRGLRNELMVKRQLTEADLTFIRAMEIAQGMEAAAENAHKLQRPMNDHTQPAPSGQRDVCKIDTRGQTDTTRRCYRCGQVTSFSRWITNPCRRYSMRRNQSLERDSLSAERQVNISTQMP